MTDGAYIETSSRIEPEMFRHSVKSRIAATLFFAAVWGYWGIHNFALEALRSMAFFWYLFPLSLGYFLLAVFTIYRVDNVGIHRRRVFVWHTWSWKEFREGVFSKGMGRYYTERGRFNAEGERTLALNWVGPAERKRILDLCRRFWKPPVRRKRGGAVPFRWKGKWYELSSEGLAVIHGHSRELIPWVCFRSVHVTQVHRDDEDFTELAIDADEVVIALRASWDWAYGYKQRWGGRGSAEEMVSLLKAHAPADIMEYTWREEPEVQMAAEAAARSTAGSRWKLIAPAAGLLLLLSVVAVLGGEGPFFPDRFVGVAAAMCVCAFLWYFLTREMMEGARMAARYPLHPRPRTARRKRVPRERRTVVLDPPVRETRPARSADASRRLLFKFLFILFLASLPVFAILLVFLLSGP